MRGRGAGVWLRLVCLWSCVPQSFGSQEGRIGVFPLGAPSGRACGEPVACQLAHSETHFRQRGARLWLAGGLWRSHGSQTSPCCMLMTSLPPGSWASARSAQDWHAYALECSLPDSIPGIINLINICFFIPSSHLSCRWVVVDSTHSTRRLACLVSYLDVV